VALDAQPKAFVDAMKNADPWKYDDIDYGKPKEWGSIASLSSIRSPAFATRPMTS